MTTVVVLIIQNTNNCINLLQLSTAQSFPLLYSVHEHYAHNHMVIILFLASDNQIALRGESITHDNSIVTVLSSTGHSHGHQIMRCTCTNKSNTGRHSRAAYAN